MGPEFTGDLPGGYFFHHTKFSIPVAQPVDIHEPGAAGKGNNAEAEKCIKA